MPEPAETIAIKLHIQLSSARRRHNNDEDDTNMEMCITCNSTNNTIRNSLRVAIGLTY